MTRKQKILLGVGIYLAVAVLLYVIFGSDGKNEEFKPQDEFKLDAWIKFEIGPIDLSFNKAVLYLLLACVLTIGTMVWIARRMQEKPNRVQTIVEGAYDLTTRRSPTATCPPRRPRSGFRSWPRSSSSSGSRTCSATSRCR